MNIFLTSPISFPGLGIEGIDPPDGFCIPGTNFEIKFYGVIIAIGVLLAVTYCLRRAKQFGVTQDDILNLVLICLPSAKKCSVSNGCYSLRKRDTAQITTLSKYAAFKVRYTERNYNVCQTGA